MGKNNRFLVEQRNSHFKLYKAKKHWVIACSTLFLTIATTTFGGTVAANASSNIEVKDHQSSTVSDTVSNTTDKVISLPSNGQAASQMDVGNSQSQPEPAKPSKVADSNDHIDQHPGQPQVKAHSLSQDSVGSEQQTVQVSTEQQWPASTPVADRVPLTKDVTRTIQFAGLPTNPAAVLQRVTFTRVAIVDKASGKVIGWVNPADHLKSLAPSDGDQAWQRPTDDSWPAYRPAKIPAGYVVQYVESNNNKEYTAAELIDKDSPNAIRDYSGLVVGIKAKPGIKATDANATVTFNFTKHYLRINVVDADNQQVIGSRIVVDSPWPFSSGYGPANPIPGIAAKQWYPIGTGTLPGYFFLGGGWNLPYTIENAAKHFYHDSDKFPNFERNWNTQYGYRGSNANQVAGKTFEIKVRKRPTHTYQFVNDSHGSAFIGSPIIVYGIPTQTGVATGLRVPTGYVLAAGQSLPSTTDFAATEITGNQDFVIHLTDVPVALKGLNGGQKEAYKVSAFNNDQIDPQSYRVELGNGLEYRLQKGDLQFSGGKPSNAGTYQVELSPLGRNRIEKLSPVHYYYDFVHSGNANFTIERAAAQVKMTGNATKTFDGTPISNYQPHLKVYVAGDPATNLLDVVSKTTTKDGQGHPTDLKNLRSGDWQFVSQDDGGKKHIWVGAKGEVAPSTVGTWQVTLTNPELLAGFDIENLNLGGPTAADQAAGRAESQKIIGAYQDWPTYSIKAALLLKFVDDDNHGAQVGQSRSIPGKVGDRVNTGLVLDQVPAGYQLAPGQELPASITIPADYQYQVHLVHAKKLVNQAKQWPLTMADADKVVLTKNITRTIHLTGLATKQADIRQTVSFSRTAIVDEVTNKVVGWVNPADSTRTLDLSQGDAAWQLTSASDQWAAYRPHFDGYVVNQVQYGQTTYQTGQVDGHQDGDVLVNDIKLITGIGAKDQVRASDSDVDVNIDFTQAYYLVKVVDQGNGQAIGRGLVNGNLENRQLTIKPADGVNPGDYYGYHVTGLPDHYTINAGNTARPLSITDPGSPWQLDYGWEPTVTSSHKEQLSKQGLWGKTLTVDAAKYQTNTVKFVDVDDHQKVVATDEIPRGAVNQTVKLDRLSLPANYSLAPGQALPTSYTYAGFNPDGSLAANHPVQVSVVHQTVAITDPRQAKVQETRQLRVQFINAATEKAMGELAPEARLDVYFRRTAKKDLVTGKVTYGNWQWDTSRGNHGYDVVAGTWTNLPVNWDTVDAAVPEVAGFEAFTNGNWQANGDGTTSQTPANQFVFPTYTNKGTTVANGNSIAYTSLADTYEAQPIHQVYYAPVVNQSRTITERFIKWENGAVGKPISPAAQLKVYYQKTPTFVSLHDGQVQISYANWQWDTTGGSPETPGFKVISGSWDNLGSAGHPDGKHSIAANLPEFPGFTKVDQRFDGGFQTGYFANPNGGAFSETDFTTNDTPIWYRRSEMTTYYVPTMDLGKVVTRTIKIIAPDGSHRNVTQKVTFTKAARLNSDDSGVLFGAMKKGTGYPLTTDKEAWDSATSFDYQTVFNQTGAVATNPVGKWARYDLTQPHYTAVIVADQAKPVGNNVLSANDYVTFDTTDSMVNVSYVPNIGKVTIKQDEVDQVFNGQSAKVPAKITYEVIPTSDYLTLPAGAQSLTLEASDFSWSKAGVDGTSNNSDLTDPPRDVGTYHLVLNQSGLQKFKNLSANFTWDYDPEGSFLLYRILPATAKATITGKATVRYSGEPVTVKDLNNGISVDLSVPTVVDGQVAYHLQAGDYSWPKLGQAVPVNVGDYSVTLASASLQHIQAALDKGFGAGNVLIKDQDLAGSAALKIEPANAVVTFSPAKQSQIVTYNGQPDQFKPADFAVVVKTDNGQQLSPDFKLSLNGGDFSFTQNGVTTTSEPTELGTYAVKLTQAGLAKVAADQTNYHWDNATGGTYMVVKNDDVIAKLEPRVSGGQAVTYSGKAFSNDVIEVGDYQVVLSNGQTYKLQPGDLAFQTVPTNAGTYAVQLSQAGQDHLSNIDSAHYSYHFGQAKAAFTVAQAVPHISYRPTVSKVYDGSAIDDFQPLAFANTPGLETVNFAAGQQYFFTQDGNRVVVAPINVGNYAIDFDREALTRDFHDHYNGQNLDWHKAWEDLGGTPAHYIIRRAEITGELSGSASSTYNGQAINSDDLRHLGNIHLSLTLPHAADPTVKVQTYYLQDGEYDWYQVQADGSTKVLATAPTNAGTYQVRLNHHAIERLNGYFDHGGDVAGTKGLQEWVGNVHLGTAKGVATYMVKPAEVTINLSGTGQATYNGQPVPVPVTDLQGAISASGLVDDGFDLSPLTPACFDWYQGETRLTGSPTEAGTYTVKLNNFGLGQLVKSNPNYRFSFGQDNAFTYKVKPAVGHVTIAGDPTDTYSGQANEKLDRQFTLKLTTNSPVSDQLSDNLQKGDLEFSADRGQSWSTQVPVNAGTYQVRLSAAGWSHLRETNNGTNIAWDNDALTNNASYTIRPVEAVAMLSGGNHKVFDHQATNLAQLNHNRQIIVTIKVPDKVATTLHELTYSLQDGDYTWETSDGGSPTAAGHYQIRLDKDAVVKHLQDLINSNDQWRGNVVVTTNGISDDTASFVIDPKPIRLTANGDSTKTYDGKAISVEDAALADSNTWTVDDSVEKGQISTAALKETDFDWYQINPDTNRVEALNTAPTNAGSYFLRINQDGLQKLAGANPNYDVVAVGDYPVTIQRAQASVDLDGTNQESVWDGRRQAIKVDDLRPTLLDNSNQEKLAWPQTVKLDQNDWLVSQNGLVTTPLEPGIYQVKLSDPGIQKITAAVVGGSNYQWTLVGSGTLTIKRAPATVSIEGVGTTPYIGRAVTIPTKQYTVKLSNGLSYHLQDGDLEFASAGNTNVGNYHIRLSAQGLANIQNANRSNGAHYLYQSDGQLATLIVIPAAASAILHNQGSSSKTYDGTPAKLDAEDYTVNLSSGKSFHLANDDLAFANEAGAVIEAPTDADSYRVVLSAKGQDRIKALTQIDTNHNNYQWTFESDAVFEIKPQHVELVVSGSATKVYDGQPSKLDDDLSGLVVTWNGGEIPPNLHHLFSPADFAVVNSDGRRGAAVTFANYRNDHGIDQLIPGRHPYYVVLKPAVLADLQAQSGNYALESALASPSGIKGLPANAAVYKIYARPAALTIKNSQEVDYGQLTPLDPSLFRIEFSNWVEHDQGGQDRPQDYQPAGDDLRIVVPTGLPVEKGVPVNVGSYQVQINPNGKLIQTLKQRYPNYDFDAVKSGPRDNLRQLSGGQDAQHNGTYVVSAINIGITLGGSQTINYGQRVQIDPQRYHLHFTGIAKRDQAVYHNGLVLPDAGDLEFVNTPNDVGHYQVRLSQQGIKHLQGLAANAGLNYLWQNAANSTASFRVEAMPVTITVADQDHSHQQTISYGQEPSIDDSRYIISVQTADGKKLDYQMVAGDLAFADGIPTAAGHYQVVLSDQGLANVSKRFGITNYTYQATGSGHFNITPANATVTLTGRVKKVFDSDPALVNQDDFTLTIKTDNGQLLSHHLQASDLRFVNDSGRVVASPINVGTYYVELTPAAQKTIKALDGNGGRNYNWQWPASSGATYSITPAAGKAVLQGHISKTYDGTSTTNLSNGDSPIEVTVSYPGAGQDATYVLQSGDYQFRGEDGTVYPADQGPINAGQYTISLTDQGRQAVAHLGAANIDWSASQAISGTAIYEIIPAPVTVSLDRTANRQVETFTGASQVLDLAQFVPKISSDPGLTVPVVNDQLFSHGDFTIRDQAGNTVSKPWQAGTYQVILNQNGLKVLQQLNGAGNFQWSPAKGNGLLVIKPAPANVTIKGSNDQAYDGKAPKTAAINDNGQIGVTITIANSSLQLAYTLQDGDYDWYQDEVKLLTPPVNAGTYTIRLNQDHILPHLEEVLNHDPLWDDNVSLSAKGQSNRFSGSAQYIIKPVAATILLGGQNHRNYSGNPVTTAELNQQPGNIAVTLIAAGREITYQLQEGDYDWYQGNQKLVQAPSNAGTYTIRLNRQAVAHLQAAIDSDLSWNGNVTIGQKALSADSGAASFAIGPVAIEVTLDPMLNRQEVVFTNQPVKLDPLKFVPALNANRVDGPSIPTGSLTVDDLTVLNPDGQVIGDLTGLQNAGTYTVAINQAGMAKLRALSHNFTWPASPTGHGQLVVKPISVTAVLAGTATKVYDGQSVRSSDLADGISLTIPILGQQLTYQLRDGDYQWSTIDGKAPLAAGTYQLTLSQAGRDHLHQMLDDHFGQGNVVVEDLTGTDQFTINPFKVNVSLAGDVRVSAGVVTIPAGHYSLAFNNGESGMDWPLGWQQPSGEIAAEQLGFIGPHPHTDTAGQDFKVGYCGTNEDLQALVGPNYEVNYINPAQDNYHVTRQSAQIVRYVNRRGEVIKTLPAINGEKNSVISFDNNANMPANWIPVDDQVIPTTITIEGGTTEIVIKHGTEVISQDIPTAWPANLTKNSFIKPIKRTIKVTEPGGQVTTITQTATLTRSGTKDLVTDMVSWNPWITGHWDQWPVPVIAGYTPSQTEVGAQIVNEHTSPTTVEVSYQANDQTTHMVYRDPRGQVVKSEPVNGKTGQRVNVHSTVPTGWQLTAGSTIPTAITFLAKGTPDQLIKVEHRLVNISHRHPLIPGKETSTGQVIIGGLQSDLNQQVTRLIRVTSPDQSIVTITQTAHLHRDATYDDVTGVVTYDNWSTDADSWAAFQPVKIAGYTATPAVVSAVIVTNGQQLVVVNVSYQAEMQRGEIRYLAGGQLVGTTPLTGRTGERIKVTPVIPAHYVQAPGQTIPQTVVASPDGIPTVVVKLNHQLAAIHERKTITRTITVTDPQGREVKQVQTVTLQRNGEHDEVTSVDTWQPWTTGRWDQYLVPPIAGYIPSQKLVPRQEVTSKDRDTTVEVAYLPAMGQEEVRYVDTFGRLIATQIVSGQEGQMVPFKAQIPPYWQVVGPLPRLVGVNNGITKIEVEPIYRSVTETKVAKRRILLHLPAGDQTVVQTVRLVRHGQQNLVTGHVNYGQWTSGHFDRFVPHQIDGYVASPALILSSSVNGQTSDSTVEIAYLPVTEQAPLPVTPSQPWTKSQSQPTTRVDQLPTTGHATSKHQVDNSGAVNNQHLVGTPGHQTKAKNNVPQRLPQTGNHQGQAESMLGLLALGLVGLLGLRKGKRE